MFKDESIRKAFAKVESKYCDYKWKIDSAARQWEKDQKALVTLAAFLLDEHALLVKGQKIKNQKDEVWVLTNCSVDWLWGNIDIEYHFKLDCTESRLKTMGHEELEKEMTQGKCSVVTGTVKSFAKNTTLVKVVKHDRNENGSTTYIGFTARGKCFVFTSWSTGLLDDEATRLFRTADGSYQLRSKRGSIHYIQLLATYKDHRELVTDFLI